MNLTKSESRGSLADGASVKLLASMYMSLITGAGLKWAFLTQAGQKSEMYERMLHGDGSGDIGTIILSNDTGGAVDYVFYTSSVYFDPKSIGASQNVRVIGQTGSLAVQGVDADGATPAAKPIMGAGIDSAGKVQTHMADTDGAQVTSPFAPGASLVDGEDNFTVTGLKTILAAGGAGTRLKVGEITITNLDSAAAIVLLYSAATLKRKVKVPAGETVQLVFPAGFRLGSNETLRADIALAVAANPVHVAATGGVCV